MTPDEIAAVKAKHEGPHLCVLGSPDDAECLAHRLAVEAERLAADRDHHAAKSELRRQELYGGIGTCAGEDGWIKRATTAERRRHLEGALSGWPDRPIFLIWYHAAPWCLMLA